MLPTDDLALQMFDLRYKKSQHFNAQDAFVLKRNLIENNQYESVCPANITKKDSTSSVDRKTHNFEYAAEQSCIKLSKWDWINLDFSVAKLER